MPSRTASRVDNVADNPVMRHQHITTGGKFSNGRERNDLEATEGERIEMYSAFINGTRPDEIIQKGISFDTITNKWLKPPIVKSMKDIDDKNFIFTIKPWRYDPSRPDQEPRPSNDESVDNDLWDDDHVRVPWSRFYISVS
ncbi:unnamed protein product [Rotaria sp. Silwood1]|nr:unnamed protein product [Rotaria sp. Silwood1]